MSAIRIPNQSVAKPRESRNGSTLGADQRAVRITLAHVRGSTHDAADMFDAMDTQGAVIALDSALMRLTRARTIIIKNERRT